MDLIGLPWRITVGPRGLAAGKVELTSRRTGESEDLSAEAAVARVEETLRWVGVRSSPRAEFEGDRASSDGEGCKPVRMRTRA